jgi:hypothetical protein
VARVLRLRRTVRVAGWGVRTRFVRTTFVHAGGSRRVEIGPLDPRACLALSVLLELRRLRGRQHASERFDPAREREHREVVAHDAVQVLERVQRARELGEGSRIAEGGESFAPVDGILVERPGGRRADLVVRQTDAAVRELRLDQRRVPRVRAERAFASLPLSAREIEVRRDVVNRERVHRG